MQWICIYQIKSQTLNPVNEDVTWVLCLFIHWQFDYFFNSLLKLTINELPNSTILALLGGTQWCAMEDIHIRPLMRKAFPYDDVRMDLRLTIFQSQCYLNGYCMMMQLTVVCAFSSNWKYASTNGMMPTCWRNGLLQLTCANILTAKSLIQNAPYPNT